MLRPILAIPFLLALAAPAQAGFAPLADKPFYSLRDEAASKTSDNPSSVATADVNGDGKLDLVVPANEADTSTGRLHVFLGDGSGRFAQPASSPSPTVLNGSGLVLADQTGDGRLDALIGNNLQTADAIANGSMTLRSGDGFGAFAFEGTYFSGGDGSAGIVRAQLAGDAQLDLAVATPKNADGTVNGRVNVFRSLGAASFSRTDHFLDGDPEPRGLAAADLNGDGRTDLATANLGGTVSVLLQLPAGGYAEPLASPYAAGATQLAGIATGDFNSDGRTDVAATSRVNPGTLAVLLGDGAGGLSPAPGSPVSTGGSTPRGITATDMNADGRPDLVVTHLEIPGSVAVLAGNGAGGFAPVPGSPFATSIVEQATALAVGDFDGDAQPDVATVHSENAARMVVLINTDEPGWTLGPGGLDFGTRPVGQPLDLQATVTNAGPGRLRVDSVAVAGSGAFAVAGNGCAGLLRVGQSCPLTVRFAAPGVGAQAASLVVVTNGNAASKSLALAGRGRAPQVSGVRALPARFAVGRRATAVSAARVRRGTVFRFSLSEAAAARLRIQRCVRPRSGSGACRRWRTKLVLRRTGVAGVNRVRFSGRTRRVRLSPGRYRVEVTAADPAGNRSAPGRASFRVVSPPRR